MVSCGDSHAKVEESPDLVLTSGFSKYPPQRDVLLKTAGTWLSGKIESDGVYPYWRIHNKLYDLSKFIDKHPGGKFWIEETQGSDITEAFESSHFGSQPEAILNKYLVEEILSPRVSPYTFASNGFYRTLKRKVSPILNEIGTRPTRQMKLIQDSLLVAFAMFVVFASFYKSSLIAIVAGVFLCGCVNVSHNFFHQRDNWRMYVFDLAMLSSYEWRISHVLSHHIFPNTIYDFEISMFEPHLELLPKATKAATSRFTSIVVLSIVALFSFFLSELIRWLHVLRKFTKFRSADLLVFIQLALMMLICRSILQGIWLWFIMHLTAGLLFLTIGLTAAHHHLDIYHEGDAAIESKDWGLLQVVATQERGHLFVNSVFLSAISFGNHTLHHLFPTVDQSILPHLIPVFMETCQEFGIKFEMSTPWELFKGFFQQLWSASPNKNISKCVTKLD